MEKIQTFLDMGGYAFYVWWSYGIAFIVMSFGIIKPVLDKKYLFRQLNMKYRRDSQQTNPEDEVEDESQA